MEDMIRAGLHVEVKEDKQLDRVLDFVGSSEIVDRDNEVIKADGWELANYRKNPVVLFAHNYRQPAVGRALRVWADKGQLKFKVQFPAMEEYGFADTLFKLYRGGYMSAVSVGFIPKEWEKGKKKDDPYRTYTRQELLELSLVPVPANPEAIVSSRGVKSALADETIDENELGELIQKLKEIAEEEVAGTEETSESGEPAINKEPERKTVYVCEECGREIPVRCEQCAEAKEPSYVDELLRDLRTVKSQEPSHEDELIEMLKSAKKETNDAKEQARGA